MKNKRYKREAKRLIGICINSSCIECKNYRACTRCTRLRIYIFNRNYRKLEMLLKAKSNIYELIENEGKVRSIALRKVSEALKKSSEKIGLGIYSSFKEMKINPLKEALNLEESLIRVREMIEEKEEKRCDNNEG